MTCDECEFWEMINDKFGTRRVNPPVCNVDLMPYKGVWPRTAAVDWCGKFKVVEDDEK